MRIEDKIHVEHGAGVVILRHPHKDDMLMTPYEARIESHKYRDPIRSYLIGAASKAEEKLA